MSSKVSDAILQLARDEYSRVCSDPSADPIDILEQANNVIDLLDNELRALRSLPDGVPRAVFDRYAWHDNDCDAIYHAGELRYPLVLCSCGFDAATAALSTEKSVT